MFSNYKFIDLTHTIHENIPVWPGSSPFSLQIKRDYDQGCRVHAYNMAAGFGTHMDSPAHFIKQGRTIADLSLEELIAPACVINVKEKADTNADYKITETDIFNWEQQNNLIPAGAIVIGYTGWATRWHDTKLYRNQDNNNQMHFPGFSKEAANLLVKRNIAGIGIDTLSLDAPIDTTFSVHHIMLGAGKFQLENLNNVEQLPASGATIFCLPIKIAEATEAPARVFAMINKKVSSGMSH